MSVMGEVVRHQLLILNRGRKRAPNLRVSDRIIAGLCTLLMRPARMLRSAIVLKPSTLLHFHFSRSVRAVLGIRIYKDVRRTGNLWTVFLQTTFGPTAESDFVEKQVVFSFCGGQRYRRILVAIRTFLDNRISENIE